jgi:predicted acyl esterase
LNPAMKRPLAGFTLLLLAATIATAQTPSPSPGAPSAADFQLRWGVKIPLRDKVELNATLYLPRNADGAVARTPVIVTLTPYTADSYHERATYLLRAAMPSRWWTCGVVGIQAESLSQTRTRPVTDMT